MIDSPDEPARIAAIAERLGKRARVMLRVTSGIHAGGHEYVSTAHEDQNSASHCCLQVPTPEIVDNIDQLQDVSPGGHERARARDRARAGRRDEAAGRQAAAVRRALPVRSERRPT